MGTDKLGLHLVASWKEGEVTYYLHASPAGPSGRIIVINAVGPEDEHRWAVLPQGRTARDAVDHWVSASAAERTVMAEDLLRRGRSA